MQTTMRKRRAQGQSLVEFALVLPLFLLLLFGVVDAGRLVYLNTVVSQAAREGTRLAAVEASWMGSTDLSCGKPSGPICPANGNPGGPLYTDVLAAANRMVAPFATFNSSDLYISCNSTSQGAPSGAWTIGTGGQATCTSVTGTNGNLISVRLRLQYQPLTPVIGQLLGSPWLYGSATMNSN